MILNNTINKTVARTATVYSELLHCKDNMKKWQQYESLVAEQQRQYQQQLQEQESAEAAGRIQPVKVLPPPPELTAANNIEELRERLVKLERGLALGVKEELQLFTSLFKVCILFHLFFCELLF